MNDALAALILLGTPGIRSSKIRVVVEKHIRYRASIAELLSDKEDIHSMFTTGELESFRKQADSAQGLLEKLENIGISILPVSDSRYPQALLRRLGSGAPLVLFCRGALKLLYAMSVGFCGSRKASQRGLDVAADCAGQLSEAGINVVSGYAAGIDLTTHVTALRVCGTTTVVLPEGIEHFRIRKDLRSVWDWSKVLVVSQFYPTIPWRVENAMKRNMIICGLSKALIVVEAGKTGGSIEAGRAALAAEIPVYAPVYEGMPETAAGNVELFSKGAKKILKSRMAERAKMQTLLEQVISSQELSLFD